MSQDLILIPPGGGTPGGSDTNLQYNNAGVFAGFADGTSHQLLHGGRTFGAVDLTTEVSGVLPITNFPVIPSPGYLFGVTVGVPQGTESSTGSDVQSSNRVYVYPFVLPFRITINKCSIRVIGAVALSHASIGIYDSSKNLVIDSTQFDTSGTGIKTTTLGASVTLGPGLFWYAWSADSTSASLNISYLTGNLYTGSGALLLNATQARQARSANSVSGGALPASLGVLTADTFSAPFVGLFET